MSNKKFYIIIGLIGISIIVLLIVLFNLNKEPGNLTVLSNRSNIINYTVQNEQTIIYQTVDNSIYKSANNQESLLLQYKPSDRVSVSTLGNYFSSLNGNNLTIYSTTQNNSVQKLAVTQFAWQKDDSFIYSPPTPKTNNPSLALDDVQILSDIFYSSKPNNPPQQITKKEVNSLLYYSLNPQSLFYLAPNNAGNSLQESILVQDNLTNSKNLGIYSDYTIKTFNAGLILSDSKLGTIIISNGKTYNNKNYSINSSLEIINNTLSALTLTNKNNTWFLDITKVEDGKTQSIKLPLPSDYNGKNLRNPRIKNSTVFFQTDSGIFSTNLGSQYAN